MTNHDPRQQRPGLPNAAAARQLRRRETLAEATLWEALRDRRLAALKFRRQRPFGPFVVDFICTDARIVVEVDGSVHDDQEEQDAFRSEVIESYGYRVLRVRNDEVMADLAVVLARIAAAVRE